MYGLYVFYWDYILGGGGFIKDSEFELGRRKYLNLLRRKRKYLKKKSRFYELMKDPLIKEYLELSIFLSEHTDDEYDDDLLAIKAFDKLAKKTEGSRGFYFYAGEDKANNKVLLVNIETKKKIEVTHDGFETLKQYNNVVVIENKDDVEDFYENKFIEVRNSYLSSLKDLDQDDAKEKILKINNTTIE